MSEDLFDHKDNLDEALKGNAAWLKRLSDNECMVRARAGRGGIDHTRGRLYFDEVNVCDQHREMGDPVYDKLEELSDEDGEDDFYARLSIMIIERKMTAATYEYLLKTSKKSIKRSMGLVRRMFGDEKVNRERFYGAARLVDGLLPMIASD